MKTGQFTTSFSYGILARFVLSALIFPHDTYKEKTRSTLQICMCMYIYIYISPIWFFYFQSPPNIPKPTPNPQRSARKTRLVPMHLSFLGFWTRHQLQVSLGPRICWKTPWNLKMPWGSVGKITGSKHPEVVWLSTDDAMMHVNSQKTEQKLFKRWQFNNIFSHCKLT